MTGKAEKLVSHTFQHLQCQRLMALQPEQRTKHSSQPQMLAVKINILLVIALSVPNAPTQAILGQQFLFEMLVLLHQMQLGCVPWFHTEKKKVAWIAQIGEYGTQLEG